MSIWIKYINIRIIYILSIYIKNIFVKLIEPRALAILKLILIDPKVNYYYFWLFIRLIFALINDFIYWNI